jgi:MATE family multidrug resistance protein
MKAQAVARGAQTGYEGAMGNIAAMMRPTRNAWAQEAFASLALSWPLILTNAAQTAMTATDVLVMGRLGAKALAAGALGVNLYFAFLIFGFGVVSAAAPMIAREVGARRHSVREVRRTVQQGLWSALAVSVPIWIVLWQCEAILHLMGQDASLAADGASYMRTMQWSILPFLMFIVLRFFLAALERPLWALAAGGLAVLINAIANWALVFGHLGLPALGLAGSGLASTIANTIAVLLLALVLVTDRGLRRYRLFGRVWQADWRRFRELWRLGLPIAWTLTFEVTIFNAAAFLMGLISATALAAHAIAIQIASIAFMVPLGLGQAAIVRVGRAFGAKDREGIARAGWTAFLLGIAVMISTALLMLLAPRLLIGAFIDLGDPANAEVIALGVSFLAFAALFQIADGAQAVGSGMLRGLHDTRVPMLIAAFGYWGVGLPLGIVLAFHFAWGGAGIWFGLASGLFTVAGLMLARWLRRERFLARSIGRAGLPTRR